MQAQTQESRYIFNPYVFYYDHKAQLKGLNLGHNFETELAKYDRDTSIDNVNGRSVSWPKGMPLDALLQNVRAHYGKNGAGKPYGIVDGLWDIERLMDDAVKVRSGVHPTLMDDENFFVFQVNGKLSYIHVWKDGSDWRFAAADDSDEKLLSASLRDRLKGVPLDHAQFHSAD